ncbi:MAG TPA: isoprenylcysteine carboxylmethyltransferase family protein [Xanthobacteraceae bacterium]
MLGDLSRARITLSTAQILRKPILLAIVLVFGGSLVVTASLWSEGSLAHETIEWIGVLLIFACIFGRAWCSLYIGGRKNSALVTVGPYSLVRNPLYVFSVIGAAGVGAQLGSIVCALIAGAFAWLVLHFVVLQEEKNLARAYGAAYRDYAARVPRYLPRFSQFRDVAVVEVHVARVRRTFIDACVFLLAMPAAEVVEYLQKIGLIPVLFHLP